MRATVTLFLLLIALSPLQAFYPRIERLHKSDPYYRQLQYEIGEYYKRFQAGKPSIPLNIYSYEVKESDTVFSLSSILNLSYDSIVTINGLDNPEDLKAGESLLIPNSPGVYISHAPETGFEELVALRSEEGKSIFLEKSGKKVSYTYISGSHLNKNERSFFLKTLFRKPLESSYVTSDFGYRIHPVFGNRHFHTGIDYRAPIGSLVYSSMDGQISGTGVLGNYGLYIIIKHDGGYETVYSHLDVINVKVNDRVHSGQVIGESGNSGISTGPHLHFEIRKGGIPLNPADFFPGD